MPYRKPLLLVGVIVALGLGAALWWRFSGAPHTGPYSSGKRITDVETTLPLPKPWTGDLEGMVERRLVRILVPYNKMLYFLDRGQERGIVHDAGMELQKWLNRKYGSKTLPIRVVFIPSSREFLLDNLRDGLGDIAAANLTITPERQKHVDFTDPAPHPVDEIVVTGPGAPALNTLADLGTVPLYVRRSSSYYEHLVNLEREAKLGLTLRLADEALEDEDLLEMVSAGMIPLAIVDNHKAKFWSEVFENLTLREDLAINRGGRIAWAIRKNSPHLMAELNAFRKMQDRQTGLTNILLKRYLGSTRYVDNALQAEELEKFDRLKELFNKYAEAYNLDPLLLMAQGYQESRLNQNVRSHTGAVGIMQVLPKTAASPPIEIDRIDTDPERNIHAGAKYLRHLMDTYITEPEVDPTNRLFLGLAAYNAGPGNLRKMRQEASRLGLSPHAWFNQVEHAAANVIGRETVQYVSNIYKYYLAYRLVEEQQLIANQRGSSLKHKHLD